MNIFGGLGKRMVSAGGSLRRWNRFFPSSHYPPRPVSVSLFLSPEVSTEERGLNIRTRREESTREINDQNVRLFLALDLVLASSFSP